MDAIPRVSAVTDKAAVRAEALAARAALPADVRSILAKRLADEGPHLARHVAASPVVAIFLPIRGEPDTLPLLAALSAAGIATALPVTVAPATPLRFRAWREGEPLVRGRYGIATPAPTAMPREPDVLFVPLAAFDGRGYRLGYGAGYYDATLAALRRTKPVLAVGVGFAAQQVAVVPTEPHDEPLDAVFTEHGLLTFGHP